MDMIGVHKVVIGVSGGIDSAVNAALYATVLPPEDILLVNMPSCYNSDTTKSLAKELADNIGCLYTVIPVQDSLELTRRQFGETVLHQGEKEKGSLALTSFIEENIQARDRSSRILAAAAASFGGVFTCNANKAETSVGYATLYGDSAGYLAATADLWKASGLRTGPLPQRQGLRPPSRPSGQHRHRPQRRTVEQTGYHQGTGRPPHLPLSRLPLRRLRRTLAKGYARIDPYLVPRRDLGKEHRLRCRRPPIISDSQGIHRRPRTVVASPLGLCRC